MSSAAIKGRKQEQKVHEGAPNKRLSVTGAGGCLGTCRSLIDGGYISSSSGNRFQWNMMSRPGRDAAT